MTYSIQMTTTATTISSCQRLDLINKIAISAITRCVLTTIKRAGPTSARRLQTSQESTSSAWTLRIFTFLIEATTLMTYFVTFFWL